MGLDLEQKHWVFFIIVFCEFFCVRGKTTNIGSQVLGQTFHNLAQTLQYLAHRYTLTQGVTKRCRLTWLTNSALVYEPKCEGEGGGVAGSQPMRTAVYMKPK